MVVLSLRERKLHLAERDAYKLNHNHVVGPFACWVPAAVAQRMPQWVTFWGIEDSAPAAQRHLASKRTHYP
jgi:hypothetical protein